MSHCDKHASLFSYVKILQLMKGLQYKHIGGYSFDSLTVILKVGVPLLQNGSVKSLYHFGDHVPQPK